MRFYQEVAVSLTCLRMYSDLELPGVVTIGLFKMGPGEKGWGLHLALGYVLDSRGQVILITLVVLKLSV